MRYRLKITVPTLQFPKEEEGPAQFKDIPAGTPVILLAKGKGDYGERCLVKTAGGSTRFWVARADLGKEL